MADHTKEEIEAGMNALRWHLNRLISDLSDNLTDKDVHQLAAGLEDALGTMDKAWDSFCRSRDGFRPPADPFPPIPHAEQAARYRRPTSEGEAQMRMEKEMGIWPDFGPEDVSVFPPIPGSDKPHWLGLVANEDEYDAWLSKLTPEQLRTHQEHMAAVMEHAKAHHSGPTKQAKVIGICLKCNGAICDGEQDDTEFPISHKGCGGEIAVHLDMPDGKPAIRLRSESSKRIKGRGLVKYIKPDGWIEHNYSKLPGWEVLIDEVLYRVLNVETAKGLGGKLIGSVGLVVRPVRKAMEE